MARSYASKGRHPYSDYMTSEGKVLHNLSGMDLIVDIEGMYFPLRTMQYAKTMNVVDEHGTGSHDPYALSNHEHTYAGSFTYASFLINGANVMTKSELLALVKALENQEDEGTPNYFDIYIIEVQGNRTPSKGLSFQEQADIVLANANLVGYIEALIDCKLTKSGRDIPEKGSVVSQREFKFSRRLPR
jgi:hypothetical protein